MRPTVSVLTVTQHSRHPSLQILKDLLAEQTYPIYEWILVEGSPTQDLARQNNHLIRGLATSIPIRYIETEGGLSIGHLRQLANRSAQGDIRVVMDDDDYYPPTRIEHAVESLLRSKKRLAGCSPMLMYDYQTQKLTQFPSFGRNHSVSSAMAWTRSYEGVYDEQARNAEESSFTRGFKERMVQLDPVHTIVQSSHTQNTYSKKGFKLVEVQGSIPEPFLSRLRAVFA
jgi:glycosyltransferase involved in cell wall biosynthesis